MLPSEAEELEIFFSPMKQGMGSLAIVLVLVYVYVLQITESFLSPQRTKLQRAF